MIQHTVLLWSLCYDSTYSEYTAKPLRFLNTESSNKSTPATPTAIRRDNKPARLTPLQLFCEVIENGGRSDEAETVGSVRPAVVAAGEDGDQHEFPGDCRISGSELFPRRTVTSKQASIVVLIYSRCIAGILYLLTTIDWEWLIVLLLYCGLRARSSSLWYPDIMSCFPSYGMPCTCMFNAVHACKPSECTRTL